MQSITDTHRQIITDFNNIKLKLDNLGFDTDNEPTSTYATDLNNIYTYLVAFEAAMNGTD